MQTCYPSPAKFHNFSWRFPQSWLKTFFLLTLLLILCMNSTVKAEEYPIYINGFLNWLKTNSDQKTGLPYSHVGDKRFAHWTITYDASVVTLAYIAADNITDAKRIIDFYLNNPAVWRLGGIIEAINTNNLSLGEDWSVRSGANIWIGIASFHLYKKTHEKQYLALSEKIADFSIGLQNQDKNAANFGGIRLGPLGNSNIDKYQYINHNLNNRSLYDIYATETNIDAYTLFKMLFIETQQKKYQIAFAAILYWLKINGYNYKAHRFNRGFNDEIIATDVQSWGLSALGTELLDRFEIGAAQQMIAVVEECCVSKVITQKDNGEVVEIEGVDFIDKKLANELKRQPLVSPEWTFQLINAYQRLSDDCKIKNQFEQSLQYEKRKQVLINNMLALTITVNNQLAYPYATNADAVIGHEHSTPKQGNLSSIGPAYAILALTGYDPLYIEKLFRN